jgi:glycosyltransferase involved in cell wall biosynthesis
VQEQILAEEHRLQGLTWRPWGDRGRYLDLRDYNGADIVHVPSLFVKQSFLQQGFPENRLLQVPYGVNLAEFRPGSEPSKNRRIIFAGSLTLRKGVGYLLDGFRRAALPRSELWLVGGTAPETKHLLRDAGTDVVILGHVPQAELADLYRQACVFVLPSVEEGQALVQAQALACGLPLICTTNTGGEDLLQMSASQELRPKPLSEGVVRYPAGYVVPIRSADAIALALKDLFGEPQRVHEMRAAAIDVATLACDWSDSASKLVAGLRLASAARGHIV